MKIFKFQRFDLCAKVALIILYLVAETREQAEEEVNKLGLGTAIEFVEELTRDQFYREIAPAL